LLKKAQKKKSSKTVTRELVSAEYLKSKAEYMKRLNKKKLQKQKEDDRYKKDLEEFTDWHKESKTWIEKLKHAKSRKQYN
jgi:hypothetical protein